MSTYKWKNRLKCQIHKIQSYKIRRIIEKLKTELANNLLEIIYFCKLVENKQGLQLYKTFYPFEFIYNVSIIYKIICILFHRINNL